MVGRCWSARVRGRCGGRGGRGSREVAQARVAVEPRGPRSGGGTRKGREVVTCPIRPRGRTLPGRACPRVARRRKSGVVDPRGDGGPVRSGRRAAGQRHLEGAALEAAVPLQYGGRDALEERAFRLAGGAGSPRPGRSPPHAPPPPVTNGGLWWNGTPLPPESERLQMDQRRSPAAACAGSAARSAREGSSSRARGGARAGLPSAAGRRPGRGRGCARMRRPPAGRTRTRRSGRARRTARRADACAATTLVRVRWQSAAHPLRGRQSAASTSTPPLARLVRPRGPELRAGMYRILVQRSIYDKVVDELAARAGRVRVGLPTDPGTHMGPQAHRAQLEKTLSYIDVGRSEGARARRRW